MKGQNMILASYNADELIREAEAGGLTTEMEKALLNKLKEVIGSQSKFVDVVSALEELVDTTFGN